MNWNRIEIKFNIFFFSKNTKQQSYFILNQNTSEHTKKNEFHKRLHNADGKETKLYESSTWIMGKITCMKTLFTINLPCWLINCDNLVKPLMMNPHQLFRQCFDSIRIFFLFRCVTQLVIINTMWTIRATIRYNTIRKATMKKLKLSHCASFYYQRKPLTHTLTRQAPEFYTDRYILSKRKQNMWLFFIVCVCVENDI